MTEDDDLAAAVHRTTVLWRPDVGPAVRRSLLTVDAARWGAVDLADRIAGARVPGGEPGWRVRWATGSGVDERLRFAFPAGPVDALAVVDMDGWPVAVTATTPHYDGDCDRCAVHDCNASALNVWDLATGERIRTIDGAGAERLVTATVDGRPVVLTAGPDAGDPRVWDLATGAQTRLTGHDGPATGAAVTWLDGRPVAVTVGWDETLRRWDLRTGQQIGEPIAAADRLNDVAVDGAVAVACGRHVRVWDLRTGEGVGAPFGDPVQMVATAVLGARAVAVTVGWDGTVVTWDLRSREPVGPAIHVAGTVTRPPIVVDRTLLLLPGASNVGLLEPVSGRPAGRPLSGATSWAATDVAEMDGRTVVVTGAPDEEAVCLWDLDATRQGPSPVRGHDGDVRACVAAGPVLVSGGDDGTVRRWSPRTGAAAGPPVTAHIGRVNALAHTADVLVTAGGTGRDPNGSDTGKDGRLRRWNPRTGEEIGPPIEAGHDGMVGVMATAVVAGLSVVLSGGNDGAVRLWDLATGDELGVQQARYMATGIATGSLDGRPVAVISRYLDPIVVWDLATGESVPTPLADESHFAERATAIVDLDGRAVFVGVQGRHALRLTDLATGERIGADVARTGLMVTAATAAEVGGRPTAAVGYSDGCVRMLELASGRPVGPALFLPARPGALALLPDGDLLVGFGPDLALASPPESHVG